MLKWMSYRIVSMGAFLLTDSLVAAKALGDVFDPWVRWERGQVGI